MQFKFLMNVHCCFGVDIKVSDKMAVNTYRVTDDVHCSWWVLMHHSLCFTSLGWMYFGSWKRTFTNLSRGSEGLLSLCHSVDAEEVL